MFLDRKTMKTFYEKCQFSLIYEFNAMNSFQKMTIDSGVKLEEATFENSLENPLKNKDR